MMKYFLASMCLLSSLLLSLTVVAREIELLEVKDYRLDMEEVMVRGQVTNQRRMELEQELWNRDRFKLSEEIRPARIEWFPIYTKDDRDQYNTVRDRTGEKPEFKFFEWVF